MSESNFQAHQNVSPEEINFPRTSPHPEAYLRILLAEIRILLGKTLTAERPIQIDGIIDTDTPLAVAFDDGSQDNQPEVYITFFDKLIHRRVLLLIFYQYTQIEPHGDISLQKAGQLLEAFKQKLIHPGKPELRFHEIHPTLIGTLEETNTQADFANDETIPANQ